MVKLTVGRWWWRWEWLGYSTWWWWRPGPAVLLQCIQQTEPPSLRSPPHPVCGSPECVLRDLGRAGTPYWYPITSHLKTWRTNQTNSHVCGLVYAIRLVLQCKQHKSGNRDLTCFLDNQWMTKQTYLNVTFIIKFSNMSPFLFKYNVMCTISKYHSHCRQLNKTLINFFLSILELKGFKVHSTAYNSRFARTSVRNSAVWAG